MFKLLIGIIAFGGLFLLLLGSMGLRILRSLFGFGKRSNTSNKDNSTRETYSEPTEKNKIFGEHEGEYVEFEEIESEEEVSPPTEQSN